jgi:septal ring factor EnvC (AmiA/AmiB activator)
MRLPEGWREGARDTWIHNDARADIFDANDQRFFVAIEGPSRATKEEAEADLERMMWALEGEDERAVLRSKIAAIEGMNAQLADACKRASTRADLSDKALDYARKEIADLRAEINRMEARERRRHPVLRKIAHALYVLRGVE